jgi:hypothetical protein
LDERQYPQPVGEAAERPDEPAKQRQPDQDGQDGPDHVHPRHPGGHRAAEGDHQDADQQKQAGEAGYKEHRAAHQRPTADRAPFGLLDGDGSDGAVGAAFDEHHLAGGGDGGGRGRLCGEVAEVDGDGGDDAGIDEGDEPGDERERKRHGVPRSWAGYGCPG